jgi:formylglycine-generating enzyme required for sulfatase activity
LSEPPAPLTDILPFIGTSYENADRTTFRVTAVGINAYVSDGDWPKDRDEKRAGTSGQLAGCANNTSYVPTGDWPFVDRPKHPVTWVHWCDAYAYCKWAGKRLCGRIGGGADVADPNYTPELSQFGNACTNGGRTNFSYGGARDAYYSLTSFDRNSCNGFENESTGCQTSSCESIAGGTLPTCQSSEAGYGGVFDLNGNVAEWVHHCDPNAPPPESGRAFCRNNGGGIRRYGFDQSTRLSEFMLVLPGWLH